LPVEETEPKEEESLVQKSPSFDENSQIVLIFAVRAETQLDEDVYVIGNNTALGGKIY
jgi:DNA-binding transcriptional regulator/RsmH inhibitor MraZ